MISRQSAALGALTVAALTSTLLVSPALATDGQQVRIHDVQGDTRVSPLAGESVRDVPGIVTGVRAFGARGFWFQEPEEDGSPATSEGVFVFTDAAPDVEVGDDVRVSGTVGEYYPGGKDAGNQSVTQISEPEVTVVSSGNPLPKARLLDARSVPSSYAPRGGSGDIEDRPLRPSRHALDLYEALEGMHVRVEDARVVGASTEHAEMWVTVKPRQNRTVRGGTRYGSYGMQNSGRMKVESLVPLSEQPFPSANVGDVLAGGTEGPLDYDQYGGYHLAARELGSVEDGGLERERTREQRSRELAVATYNVENLQPGDDQEKFDRLAEGLVTGLASPDIVALEEIQDNSGPEDDGTVAADKTVGKLIEAVAAAGGPRYAWRGIAPEDKKDGGQPGGNIRNVFLYNPDRVDFVDRPGGDATTATEVVARDGRATLSLSPGRVEPSAEAWEDSRKSLAGEFRFRGRTVIVVANHFASKGGDQSLHGRFQPPTRPSEEQRVRQARVVNEFVNDILAVERKADVVVLGDVNDFEFSPTTARLTDGGVLRSAVTSLPRRERYTYVYEGNSQVLDQTLVSPGVGWFDYDIVHTNAEFADQVSDHDPQVLRFRP